MELRASHLTEEERTAFWNILSAKVEADFQPTKWEILGVKRCILQAYTDVTNLDSWAKEAHNKYRYRSRYLSDLQHPNAIEALYKVGRMPWNAKATKGVLRAVDAGESTKVPLLAHSLRELLRDGYTWEQAREIASTSISDAVNQEAEGLFQALGQIEQQYDRDPTSFVRSPEGWLVRAWIPLGLWACDTREAERRLREAYECLKQEQTNLPAMPDVENCDRLIIKVRSRLATGKR